MKKYVVLIVFILFPVFCIHSQNTVVSNFLENYFGTKVYSSENYTLSGKPVTFAYKLKKNNPLIFDKGIIFTVENKNSIIPLIYFFENSIFNSDELLFSGRVETQTFFGWSVKIVEKNNSFSTKFYTDNGTYVTEGPIFIWDASKLKFKQFIIDKTMM